MSTYETKIYSLIVKPIDKEIFDDLATVIGVDDEGGGVYITISQEKLDSANKISITPEEWPFIKAAVERLMKEWRE